MQYNPEEYSDSFSLHGESPKALRWNTYASAAVRFRHLTAGLDIEGRSILDVGCGMGDLLPYLCAKTLNFKYLGVDKQAEFIEIAQKRYEGYEFKTADIFDDGFSGTFDVIISSGVLNANKTGWWDERKKRLTKLFGMTKEALAFNMAGGIEDIPDDELIAYVKGKDLFDFCATLTPKIIFKSHYTDRDLTVILFK